METLVKADIFFFICSISTVVVTILICFLLFYVIKAGKNLYDLTEALKGHFKDSEEFVLDLKERIENNLVFQLFFPRTRNRRKTRAKDKEE